MAGIYVVSNPTHAALWRRYREEGYPIISSWIDDPEVYNRKFGSNVYTPNWLIAEREVEICSCGFIYSNCEDLSFAYLIHIGMLIGNNKNMYCLGSFRGINPLREHPQFLFKNFPEWDIERTLKECQSWDRSGISDTLRKEQHYGKAKNSS
jgi:hypothetical protein